MKAPNIFPFKSPTSFKKPITSSAPPATGFRQPPPPNMRWNMERQKTARSGIVAQHPSRTWSWPQLRPPTSSWHRQKPTHLDPLNSIWWSPRLDSTAEREIRRGKQRHSEEKRDSAKPEVSPRDGTLCHHSRWFPKVLGVDYQCFLLCLDPDPPLVQPDLDKICDLKSGRVSTVDGSMDSSRSFGWRGGSSKGKGLTEIIHRWVGDLVDSCLYYFYCIF